MLEEVDLVVEQVMNSPDKMISQTLKILTMTIRSY